MTLRVGFRCDAGPSVGIGHVMRSLALAEELASRGAEPVFFADMVELPWASEQLAGRGYAVHEQPLGPEQHVERFTAYALDAVVFDSYHLQTQVYRAVQQAGLTTMAIIDGSLRDAEADLFLDQNIGSEHDDVRLPKGSLRIAGLPYALLRDEVIALRPSEPKTVRERQPARVLVVFGGTDAFGAGPGAVAALAATRKPLHMTVVAPREELWAKTSEIELFDDQTVHLIGPTNRLAQLISEADLVVSAAGSSSWELLSLGACAALVCVSDNQRSGYRRLVDAGLVAGLGTLQDLQVRRPILTEVLNALVTDHHQRQALATAAWKSIDGRGRIRVADVFLRLCATREGKIVR